MYRYVKRWLVCLVCALSEDEKDPKAAHCPFDDVKFRSMHDLKEIVKRRTLRATELDISPRPYGTCCRNRFEPAVVSPHNYTMSHNIRLMV